MARQRILTGQGSAHSQIFIDDGAGGSGLTSLPILQGGILIGNAQKLNFIGAAVAVDGGDPTQINVTISAAGIVQGFGILLNGAGNTTINVDTSTNFTGANKWTGNHEFSAATLAFTKETSHSVAVNPSTTANANGGGLTIKAADATAGGTGLGGVLTLESGRSGAADGSPSDGHIVMGALSATIDIGWTGNSQAITQVHSLLGVSGNVQFDKDAGHSLFVATSTLGAGGALGLLGGTGAVDTDGGDCFVQPGTGGAASAVAGGNGGELTLQSGAAGVGLGALSGGIGGLVFIAAFSGGTGTATGLSGTGGDVEIHAGRAGVNGGGGAGLPGTVSIHSATSRNALGAGAAPNATVSGNILVQVTQGGNATAVGNAGASGSITIQVLSGGNGSAAHAAGAGGSISITAGSGGTNGGGGGAAGGSLTLDAGLATGAATSGAINIGTTNAESVTIGRTGKSIVLGVYTLDSTGTFTTTTTAASITSSTNVNLTATNNVAISGNGGNIQLTAGSSFNAASGVDITLHCTDGNAATLAIQNYVLLSTGGAVPGATADQDIYLFGTNDMILSAVGNLNFNPAKLGLFGVTAVAQSGAIPDAAGGGVIDTQARAAINTLLAYLRTRGDIAP